MSHTTLQCNSHSSPTSHCSIATLRCCFILNRSIAAVALEYFSLLYTVSGKAILLFSDVYNAMVDTTFV